MSNDKLPTTPDPEDREELSLTDMRAIEAEEQAEKEYAEAVEQIAASGILGDSELIAEVVNEPDPIVELAEESGMEERMAQIAADINSRAPEHDVQPSTARVVHCLDILGNPQDSYRSIHITGTNGKTSTSRMIAALLEEKGMRVGRYSSPHMHTMRERITIDGQTISRAGWIDTWEQIQPAVEMVDMASVAQGGPRMSTFEIYTVMAYAAFADAPVDVAVIEVGMGGLWDATNVIDADVAVITTVDVDHARYLGNTREEVATEKVGIIKDGATVISAIQHPEVLPILAEAVSRHRAHLELEARDLHLLDRTPGVGGQMISVQTPAATYHEIPFNLLGRHQARNATLAIGAVEAFFGGGALDATVLEHALMSVQSPGRLEVVRNSPTVVADGGHNPAGVEATVAAMKETFHGPIVAVFAAMADKEVEQMLGVLEPVLDAIVVTHLDNPRALPIEDLREIAEDVFGEERVREEYDLLEAVDAAATLAEQVNREEMTAPAVLTIGSIELASRVRELFGRAARSI
ncbi:bifunctional folylpolyglutamate synthase/dihydrofolate synthase [Flaviflexus massiliensis]|uniref:bifunctional folylpolyglutamate synthase/dihydrofolate synthase n=1 Tax=Flaviflexus massiliensis TaxID=1522309 RepID=UPI000A4A3BE0|nr:folylpolyglutamate synthase/dihydrofolate synthase family protein [Flaviflexus massiliensis]